MSIAEIHFPQRTEAETRGQCISPRVLLVDDDILMRFSIATRLRTAGCDVQEAGNGREALSALSKHPFELVLSDIHMPVMSGLELLQEIVKKYGTTQVILMTASDDIELSTKALQMGAVDYFTKSSLSNNLVERVWDALNSHKLKRLWLHSRGYEPYPPKT